MRASFASPEDAPPALVVGAGDGAVRVWFASLDRDPSERDRFARALSPTEIERAARFRLGVHRDRFVVRRGLLRALLGAELGLAPGSVRFTYGAAGKPELAPDLGGSGLRFNASHSGSLAAFALARGVEIGIDVEEIRAERADPGVAARCFSATENEVLRGLPPGRRTRAFFACWTRKEAFVKARGDGLSCPLDAFDVELRPDRPVRLLRTAWDPEEADRWGVDALEPREGWVGALVSANRGKRVETNGTQDL